MRNLFGKEPQKDSHKEKRNDVLDLQEKQQVLNESADCRLDNLEANQRKQESEQNALIAFTKITASKLEEVEKKQAEHEKLYWKSSQQFQMMQHDMYSFRDSQRGLNEDSSRKLEGLDRKLESLGGQYHALERAQANLVTISNRNEDKVDEVNKVLVGFQSEYRQIIQNAAKKCDVLAEQQRTLERAQGEQKITVKNTENKIGEVNKMLVNFQSEQRQLNGNLEKRCNELENRLQALEKSQNDHLLITKSTATKLGEVERQQAQQMEFNLKSGKQFTAIQQDLNSFKDAQRGLIESAGRKLNTLGEQQHVLERAQGEQTVFMSSTEDKLYKVDRMLSSFQSEQNQINQNVVKRCDELVQQQNEIKQTQMEEVDAIERKIKELKETLASFEKKQPTSQDVLYLKKKQRHVEQQFNSQHQLFLGIAFVITVLVTIVYFKW